MNNLIIKGIDHSRFDLEWAKRGDVFVVNMDDQSLTIITAT